MNKSSYHHGNLKAAILKEALKLLNLKSYDELSFRLISRNIGVVSSAPYNHFKDKGHLINEIIIYGKDKLFEDIKLAKKKSNLPTEQLYLIAKAYLKFASMESTLFNLMFSNKNKELLQLTDKVVIQFEEIITEKFKNGKRLKVTVKGSAITAWSMIHGIAVTLNSSKREYLESLWNLKLEEIFKEMSAIWGKGVSN
ncbi:MAG: hypothetical protein CMP36_00625 [Rickettsiales bacterium]|nr:hypothetical protein [Rickettsiales bacterium]OUV83194.1 MAG: hypothetical protein CBC91_01005 [Rickettsiales bacterium TMED131]